MPRSRMYSIEEVLNFTVKDVQGPNLVDVKVKGWLKLTSEQRERCIMKLRDLVRQRDEMVQSIAVDANDLEDRLKRINRSRSPTPILPPFDPNGPEFLEENLRREREAYEALICSNGRPCYPIELGFEVFNSPGQYKDVFSYWREEPGVHQHSPLIFSLQLERWKDFRLFQQKNRRYFVFHSRFLEFQQKVLERRQRHGLDGDVQLLEDQHKQSKLDDWMEYQDYELRTYERFEQDLMETQARLAFRRKTLAEAGISAFEGIHELEFASYYSLAIECGGQEARARKKKDLAERKLRLAEKRLKTAGSNDLGNRVERSTWVRFFQREVEFAHLRLDELQNLAEDARRELEPFKRWLQARHNDWDEFSEEGMRLVKLETESTEFQDRDKKLRELEKKEYEAEMTYFTAEEEVEFAEEGLNAARLDDLEETVERAALIKMAQEEVRSAQAQVEEERELTEKIELKGKVISALSSISCTKGKMKRHRILLEWIEQQRREIANGPTNTKNEGGQGRSKRASSRAFRNHSAIKTSNPDNPPKASGRKRKQCTTRSILSPIDPAKVSKATSKRRSSHPETSVPWDTSQAVETTTTDSSTKSRRKQAFKVKDAMPAFLRPILSSRVSKPVGKRPTKRPKNRTNLLPTTDRHRLIGEDNVCTSSNLSTARKAIQQSGNASLRKSTRISKPPKRFYPGCP